MRNIVIVDPVSTGANFVEDAVRRGYNPVVLTSATQKDGTLKEMIQLGTLKEGDTPDIADILYTGLFRRPVFIEERGTYDETLRLVRGYSPAAVVAGADTGVVLAARLAADLGLPGNPVEHLDAMTKKDAMHEALKQAGLRHILGQTVASPAEALAFCRENALDCAVIKPLQSAASQGVFLCDNLDEVRAAAEKILAMTDLFGRPIRRFLVQERIRGPEYIVNTVSARGKHRLNSLLRYKKVKTPEGGHIYDYIEYMDRLEAGTEELVRYALAVADAIHCRFGMIHGEYMVDAKGPVLIEVNCRPMGCSQPSDFLDRIYGQHETDTVLDALLSPDRFLRDLGKPYRGHCKAYIKLIMIPAAMEAQDHPIWEIARQLKSTYKVAAPMPGTVVDYPKTRDLETNGGMIYLVHEDPQTVDRDLLILRLMERDYFQLLLSDGMSSRWFPYDDATPTDPAALLRDCDAHGAVLLAADTLLEIEGAQCITPSTLSDAHKGFDCVVIAYERTLLDLHEKTTLLLALLFDTMELVREGGRVVIPRSTYRYLAYGRKGAEQLLLVKGLELQHTSAAPTDSVIAVRPREKTDFTRYHRQAWHQRLPSILD